MRLQASSRHQATHTLPPRTQPLSHVTTASSSPIAVIAPITIATNCGKPRLRLSSRIRMACSTETMNVTPAAWIAMVSAISDRPQVQLSNGSILELMHRQRLARPNISSGICPWSFSQSVESGSEHDDSCLDREGGACRMDGAETDRDAGPGVDGRHRRLLTLPGNDGASTEELVDAVSRRLAADATPSCCRTRRPSVWVGIAASGLSARATSYAARPKLRPRRYHAGTCERSCRPLSAPESCRAAESATGRR